MDPQKQKEAFNYAYVCALAAHAGFNRVDAAVDDDSIDVGFKGRGYLDRQVRSPQIEFQLKCSSQDLVDGGVIKFKLPLKNYEDLRGENVGAPRYLAILLVPDDLQEWVAHNESHIALFKNCYWLSLKDAPPTDNDTSVTVHVPLAQRLTSQTLREMMDRASNGDWL